VYSSDETVQGFHVTPLSSECIVGDARVKMASAYNPEVLTAEELERFYDCIESNILYLWNLPNEKLLGF
jgi:hypothetical protein